MQEVLEIFIHEASKIEILPLDEKVEVINKIRELLHEISPFKNEPVDYIRWVKADSIQANDYNPNKVAPPEMKLLEQSISENGYTQPIVAWDPQKEKEVLEVVDGFHRNRVGKEVEKIKERIHGYLPVVVINTDKTERGDRIAATIRHNRARGKHTIQSMSEIVLELKNRNWTNKRISKQLGLDEDEILRLTQITGLQNLFKDADFSRSWNIEDTEVDDNFSALTDEISEEEREEIGVRTVNTNDPNRIFHTHDKWECHKAGFYNTSVEGKTERECKAIFSETMADNDKFKEGLQYVIDNWKHSCEHYLTNKGMNRIAWLGQAAICQVANIPSKYASAFYDMTPLDQEIADKTALEYLNKWLERSGQSPVTLAEARMDGKTVNIY